MDWRLLQFDRLACDATGTFCLEPLAMFTCYSLYTEECDYLRMKAEKRLERSGVVDTATGAPVVSDIRTSDGMFFERGEDAIIEGGCVV